MAGKSDFTEEEWEQLRRGVTGAGCSSPQRPQLLRQLQGGGLDGEVPRILAGLRQPARPRARGRARQGFHFGESPQEVESGAMGALQAATTTLHAKAPDEFEPYRLFVLELARSVGKAAGGGDAAETAALQKIEAALA